MLDECRHIPCRLLAQSFLNDAPLLASIDPGPNSAGWAPVGVLGVGAEQRTRACHSCSGERVWNACRSRPMRAATGTPSRIRMRLLRRAGTRSPGVMMPVRLMGSVAAMHTVSPRWRLAPPLREALGCLGQGELLAGEAVDEAPAVDLAAGLHASQAAQQVPPRHHRQLAFQEALEDNAVALEQQPRDALGVAELCQSRALGIAGDRWAR